MCLARSFLVDRSPAPLNSAPCITSRQLESAPRRAYCGTLGVIQPGGTCTFNVAIRTVELTAQPATENSAPQWAAQCGIGSGITLDATAAGEALEWHHKQAFLRRAAQPFELLESLRLEDGLLARLPQHLARLRRAAQHFGVPLDENQLQASLNTLTQQYPTGVYKVRLLVDVAGGVMAEAAPLPNPTGPVRVGIASAPMPQADEFIWHKTTRRDAYQAFKAQPGCFDTLLYNRLGELTEFTIGQCGHSSRRTMDHATRILRFAARRHA
jgi:para-aminobenzoate synthetase/4-amino-4-deoxychorismate lyase